MQQIAESIRATGDLTQETEQLLREAIAACAAPYEQ